MPRRAIRLVLLAGWLLGLTGPGLLPPAPPAAQAGGAAVAWSHLIIDSAGDVGAHLSLAVQPTTGLPHIAYYDTTQADLKLAFPSASGDCGPSATWLCSSLNFVNNDDFGEWPAIGFNSAGQWGIAYYSDSEVQAAFRGIPALGATEQFFDNIHEAGGLTDLDVNQAGEAEVAFGTVADSSLAVGHARYVDEGGNCGDEKWRCVAVDALDANNFTTDLAIATLAGGGFAPDTMIAYRGAGGGLWMAFYPALFGTANCGQVGLIATWYCFALDSAASVRAVAVDALDGSHLYVAYVDDGDNQRAPGLWHAAFTPAGGNCGNDEWTCRFIDEAYLEPDGFGVSMAMWNGQPVVAYVGKDPQGRSVIKVARPQSAGGNCGRVPPLNIPTWQCDVVDDGMRGDGYHDVGNAIDLAIDAAGRAYIAYYDATDGDLLLAVPVFQLWLPVVMKQ